MKYELLKRLKEAGFPQHATGDYGEHNCGCPNIYSCTPTLSELIEACGHRMALRKNSPVSFDATDGHHHKHGTTPEEAVALCWLALNEK